MNSRVGRSLAAVFLALVLAGLAALLTLWPPKDAEAQTAAPPTAGTVPEEWAKRYGTYDKVPMRERVAVYERISGATKSPNPVLRDAGSRVLTRSIGRVVGTRVGAAGSKLGYAGAAAGVWTVVYFELKYASELGYQGTVYNPLRISPARGSVKAVGINEPSGKVGGYLFLDSLSWQVRTDGSFSARMTYRGYPETFDKYVNPDGTCSFLSTIGGVGVQGSMGFNKRELVVRYAPCASAPSHASELLQMSGTGWLQQQDYYLRKHDWYVAGWTGGAWGKGYPVTYDKITQASKPFCRRPGCSFERRFPTFQLGPSPTTQGPEAPPSVASTPEEGNRIIDGVVADPESPTVVPGLPPANDPFWTTPGAPPDPAYPYPGQEQNPDDPFPAPAPNEPGYNPELSGSDPDGDGLPNRDDPDDDGDHVPDASDPRPYSPEGKPWLLEGFRAPSDPLQREALWGPVVQKWTMTEGRDCKEYEYVTVVCDYPDGHAYVLVEKEWAEWFQYSGGEKDWFFRPQDKPSPAPTPTLTRDRRNDVPAVFYRGQTLYDALRDEQEGFSQTRLEERQAGRELGHGPGLYTSRNREVARYFGVFNANLYPGQGGAAMMTVVLRQRDFDEMRVKYGVLDNVPVTGLPPGVPPPHVETVFPYASLTELNAKTKPPAGAILVEPVPMP